MKRILALGLVITVTLLAGCAGGDSGIPAPSDTPGDAVLPDEPASSGTPAPSNTPGSVILPDDPPVDRTWVSPGKVNIGNFHPGARAEYPVTIHNGKDTAVNFNVTYRYPDHVATGYEKPPTEAQDWVIIADSTPLLLPKETRDVLIALVMPEEAEVTDKKWEFWVSVIDMSQKGTVRTELAVRWLVDMR